MRQRGYERRVYTVIKDNFLFDKRIVKRNIDHGLVKQEEYLNHIEKLKDCADETDNFEALLTSGGRRVPSRVMEDEDDIF